MTRCQIRHVRHVVSSEKWSRIGSDLVELYEGISCGIRVKVSTTPRKQLAMHQRGSVRVRAHIRTSCIVTPCPPTKTSCSKSGNRISTRVCAASQWAPAGPRASIRSKGCTMWASRYERPLRETPPRSYIFCCTSDGRTTTRFMPFSTIWTVQPTHQRLLVVYWRLSVGTSTP